jgi:hypothetical protein
VKGGTFARLVYFPAIGRLECTLVAESHQWRWPLIRKDTKNSRSGPRCDRCVIRGLWRWRRGVLEQPQLIPGRYFVSHLSSIGQKRHLQCRDGPKRKEITNVSDIFSSLYPSRGRRAYACPSVDVQRPWGCPLTRSLSGRSPQPLPT